MTSGFDRGIYLVKGTALYILRIKSFSMLDN